MTELRWRMFQHWLHKGLPPAGSVLVSEAHLATFQMLQYRTRTADGEWSEWRDVPVTYDQQTAGEPATPASQA